MTARWYAVHAYSNFENKVAESIREQAKQRGLSSLFEDIMVPKEKVVEVRRGRKVDAERKFFPGYVLVKMEMTDEAYHLIKNTPKVTGFLGSDNKPMPLSEVEAQRLLQQVQEGIEQAVALISLALTWCSAFTAAFTAPDRPGKTEMFSNFIVVPTSTKQTAVRGPTLCL